MSQLDLLGRSFGRLVVISQAESKYGKSRWLCRCECGATTVVVGSDLVSGHTQSCGCLGREAGARNGSASAKHRLGQSRLYHIWQSMKQRCSNPRHKSYHSYGGRGISVCDAWLDDFLRFRSWALANGHQKDLTLDRIDNDGNYEPGNCRWVTWAGQATNRRTNRLITHSGEPKTLADWARTAGIGITTLHARLAAGWSIEHALSTPSRTRKEVKIADA